MIPFFDDMIGELQKDSITTFFGPPGIGKSTICFQYVCEFLKLNKKVIYIDTEGGFSVERIKQIYPEVNLNNIIVFSPKSFEEQQKSIHNLNKHIKSDNIGVIIVDSLVMLYRLKLGDNPQGINNELAEQLRLLTELSRTYKIPIIVTNQMYKDFETKENKMVGGTLARYWSKTIINLDFENEMRYASISKHKFKKEGEKKYFEINDKGVFGL